MQSFHACKNIKSRSGSALTDLSHELVTSTLCEGRNFMFLEMEDKMCENYRVKEGKIRNLYRRCI